MSSSMTHPNTTLCRFNDCDNLAVHGTDKCSFHKNRRQCIVEQCTNQVYARKLCVRHGGKKQCQAEGCDAHARGGGYCLQHGGFAVKRFCVVDGCNKQAHARQKCVRHGGGRRCRVSGCMQHARAGGLCNRHSHGHECRVDGCNKIAQHMGSICFHHAMELRARGKYVPETTVPNGSRKLNRKADKMHKQKFRAMEKTRIKQEVLSESNHSENKYTSIMNNPAGNYISSERIKDQGDKNQKTQYNLQRTGWSDTIQLPSVSQITSGSVNGNGYMPYMASEMAASTSFSTQWYSRNQNGQGDIVRHIYALDTAARLANSSYKANHQHAPSGEDELEYILNSYSKLISPAAFTSHSGYEHAEPQAQEANFNTEDTLSDSVSTVSSGSRSYATSNSLITSAPPSLVRLNSLLPPPPGIITGHIPQIFPFPNESIRVPAISPKNADHVTSFRAECRNSVGSSRKVKELAAQG